MIVLLEIVGVICLVRSQEWIRLHDPFGRLCGSRDVGLEEGWGVRPSTGRVGLGRTVDLRGCHESTHFRCLVEVEVHVRIKTSSYTSTI